MWKFFIRENAKLYSKNIFEACFKILLKHPTWKSKYFFLGQKLISCALYKLYTEKFQLGNTNSQFLNSTLKNSITQQKDLDNFELEPSRT